MTFEEFKALAVKIERSARDPKLVEEVLACISKLSTDEINAQYKRSKTGSSSSLPNERLLEVTIKTYLDAIGIASARGEEPESGVLKIIKALIDKGASFELLDSEGQPPLHQMLCFNSNPDFLKRYLNAIHEFYSYAATRETVDFNIKNSVGDNLPIRAARTRHYALIEWLHSQYDCDLNLPNKGLGAKYGLTVLDILSDVPPLVKSSNKLVDIMIRYVCEQGGVSGRDLAKGTITDLGKRLGKGYERAAKLRQPPKSQDQILRDLGPSIMRHAKDNP